MTENDDKENPRKKHREWKRAKEDEKHFSKWTTNVNDQNENFPSEYSIGMNLKTSNLGATMSWLNVVIQRMTDRVKYTETMNTTTITSLQVRIKREKENAKTNNET